MYRRYLWQAGHEKAPAPLRLHRRRDESSAPAVPPYLIISPLTDDPLFGVIVKSMLPSAHHSLLHRAFTIPDSL